ncbi:MAG: hypothetical protein V1647_02400 [Pseudomonadota bacterium]
MKKILFVMYMLMVSSVTFAQSSRLTDDQFYTVDNDLLGIRIIKSIEELKILDPRIQEEDLPTSTVVKELEFKIPNRINDIRVNTWPTLNILELAQTKWLEDHHAILKQGGNVVKGNGYEVSLTTGNKGNPTSITVFRNGQMDGRYGRFDGNTGILRSEGTYTGGIATLKNDDEIEYDQFGFMISKTPYVADKIVGIKTEYYPSLRPIANNKFEYMVMKETPYNTEGKKEGTGFTYDLHKNIVKEENYKDDMLQGPSYEYSYSKNGEIWTVSSTTMITYDKGVQSGAMWRKRGDKGGVPIFETNYVVDDHGVSIESGARKEYVKGKLYKKMRVAAGLRDGWETTYDIDDNSSEVVAEARFLNGRNDGYEFTYFTNATHDLRTKTFYKDGLKEGISYTFFPSDPDIENGLAANIIDRETEFKNGIRLKETHYYTDQSVRFVEKYSSDGLKVVSRQDYKAGEKIVEINTEASVVDKEATEE